MNTTNIQRKLLSGIFFLLLSLLLLTNGGSATVTDTTSIDSSENNNYLGRLLAQFISSSSSSPTNTGLLRRLVNSDSSGNDKIKNQFGPGADWSCTTAKGVTDFHSCTTLTILPDTTAAGCSWCPLGSTTGVCLRTDQAELVNGLENDHLLHLKCYNSSDDSAKKSKSDTEAKKFWDEAVACKAHDAGDCLGDHHGDDGKATAAAHSCTWCTVDEPAMGMCLSQTLWDNLAVAQALEEFDNDVSTSDQIRLDQVIHCSHVDDDDAGSNIVKSSSSSSVWNTKKCGDVVTEVKTHQDEADCLAIVITTDDDDEEEKCVVQANPFPGFMGSTPGKHCVTLQQQRVMVWAIELLHDMGWENEMSSFQ